MNAIENSRAEFEAFVSAPPYEYNTDRYPGSAAFPGTYKSLRVDLAWCAWQEAQGKMQARVAKLEAKLSDAAASLNTIATQAGKAEGMMDMIEVRVYARNRATCAGYSNQIEGGE